MYLVHKKPVKNRRRRSKRMHLAHQNGAVEKRRKRRCQRRRKSTRMKRKKRRETKNTITMMPCSFAGTTKTPRKKVVTLTKTTLMRSRGMGNGLPFRCHTKHARYVRCRVRVIQ